MNPSLAISGHQDTFTPTILRGGGKITANDSRRAFNLPFGLSRRISRSMPMHASPLDAGSVSNSGSAWEWRKRQIGSILRFSIPALSIPLADPVMSLVDSVCVGQYASTVELAALGPNLVIFNFITFTFSFLAIGTTLRVSAALAKDNRKEAADTITTALLIATISGLLLVAYMLVLSAPTIAATGAVHEILEPAGKYLLVRIWACPAVLATAVLQSGLLAQRDSVTCMLAVVVSATFNVVGDIFLITVMKMGLVGAAWATMLGMLFQGCACSTVVGD